ncbi:hypothetical protein HAL1_03932 [Halomonas sp. HAL1]|nr:hypothetical protein HAL1_03932 [Halomonas sp. HAL1]
MQQKTHRPVPFEITEQTRVAIIDWIPLAQLLTFPPSLTASTQRLATD